jgi:hypothetical protein
LSSSHKKTLFVTNLFKINIFWFSSITWLKQDLTRRVWYSILQKVFFNVMMTTEMFINYFCNIKLCCLWRFDDNMSVIYWEIICAKILFYIYCFRVTHLYTCQQGRVKLPLCPLWIVMPLPPVTPLSHLYGHSMLPYVEVSHPKAINIKQYLSPQ